MALISRIILSSARHSGMFLAGEVVHGRTDNGPKDGAHSLEARFRLKTCRNDGG